MARNDNETSVGPRRRRLRTFVAILAAAGSLFDPSAAAALTFPEQLISDPASPLVLHLDVALADTGAAVVGWAQDDGSGYSVMARRTTDAGAWMASLPLGNGSALEIFPEVAVGRSGYAYVSWLSMPAGPSEAYVSVWRPGSGWDAPRRLNAGADPASRPAVASGPNGTALAVWAETNGASNVAYAREFVPASGWSGATLLSPANAQVAWVDVTAQASGDCLISWVDFGGDNVVYALKHMIGGPWGQGIPIGTAASGTAYLTSRGAVNESGASVVTWLARSNSSGIYRTIAAQYTAGSGWGVASTLSFNGTTLGLYPRVAASPGSGFVVVFAEVEGGVLGAFVRGTNATGGWAPGARISTGPGVRDIGICAGTFGGPTVAWGQSGSGRDSLLVRRWETAGQWSAPFSPAPESGGNISFIDIACNRDGSASVGWIGDEGGVRRAYAAPIQETTPPALMLVAPIDGATTTVSSVWVRGRTEPGADVLANGVAAQPDAQGDFAMLVPLAPGSNTIDVTATDRSGNRASASVGVLFEDPVPGLLANLSTALAQIANQSERLAFLENYTAVLENRTSAILEVLNATLAALEATVTALTAEVDALSAAAQGNDLPQRINETQGRLASAEENLTFLVQALILLNASVAETAPQAALFNDRLSVVEDKLFTTRSDLSQTAIRANAAAAAAEQASNSAVFATVGVFLGVAGLLVAAAAVVLARKRRRTESDAEASERGRNPPA